MVHSRTAGKRRGAFIVFSSVATVLGCCAIITPAEDRVLRFSIAVAPVLVLSAAAPAGAQPCACIDIGDIKQRIREADTAIKAYSTEIRGERESGRHEQHLHDDHQPASVGDGVHA
jgi:hypothetical protein